MSRIIFTTQVAEQSIQVTVGWDRPLRQCFVSIPVHCLDLPENDDVDEDDEVPPELQPLFSASEKSLSALGLDEQGCKDLLREAGVEAPAAVWQELAEHVRENLGNRIVKIKPDGQIEMVHHG